MIARIVNPFEVYQVLGLARSVLGGVQSGALACVTRRLDGLEVRNSLGGIGLAPPRWGQNFRIPGKLEAADPPLVVVGTETEGIPIGGRSERGDIYDRSRPPRRLDRILERDAHLNEVIDEHIQPVWNRIRAAEGFSDAIEGKP
jgi:hypothetical protein